MPYCASINCTAPTSNGGDFCSDCVRNFGPASRLHIPYELPSVNVGPSGPFHEQSQESSGGDNDYWVARISHPKRLEPYDAECEDLIEHFQMTFQEGEAFKALWRKGQARIGNGKPGDSPLRNAQKVRHFGARMEVMEERKLEEA